jgi:hypothetical protein
VDETLACGRNHERDLKRRYHLFERNVLHGSFGALSNAILSAAAIDFGELVDVLVSIFNACWIHSSQGASGPAPPKNPL